MIAILILKVGTIIASGLVLVFGASRLDPWAVTLIVSAILWIVAAVPVLSHYRRISANVTLKTYESVDAVDSTNRI